MMNKRARVSSTILKGIIILSAALFSTTVNANPSNSNHLSDVNLVGNDIGAVWDAKDPGQCEVACGKNNNCKAWTWVKPGAIPEIPRSGLAGFCALKGAKSNKTKDNCCVSGYPSYTISGYGEAENTDKAIAIMLYKRFQVVMNGEAILDKETELVWERQPDAAHKYSWAGASSYCLGKSIGSRKGWRLPSAWELASLHAPGNNDHHFRFPEKRAFWTSTFKRGKRGIMGDAHDYSERPPILYKVIASQTGLTVVSEGEEDFTLREASQIIGSSDASPLCVRDWYYQ